MPAGFVEGSTTKAAYSYPELNGVDAQNFPDELRSIVRTIDSGRQRTLINTFLRVWAAWWNWILAGLIVAGLFITRLRSVTISAVALIVLGAAGVAAWTWRHRPSRLDIARSFDSSTGLQDRISTALYLSEDSSPAEIKDCQRRDAIAKIRQVNVHSVFYIHAPATIRRTLALFVIVAALLTYRMYHQPPFSALLRSTDVSGLVRSIFATPKRNPEQNIAETQALANRVAETTSDSARPEQSAQPVDEPHVADKNAVAGDNAQGQSSEETDQDQSSKANSKGAVSQGLLDALKGLFSNEGKPDEGKRQQGNPNDQQANATQTSPADGGDQRQAQQGADSFQKNPQGTANGAGDQQAGSKEMKKSTPLAIKPVPDRVQLQSVNLKDQPRMDVTAEAGTAKIANGNAMPQAAATVNGAEQESVPARYRSYVQRYFEHADDGKQ